jgi:hypothetical protein
MRTIALLLSLSFSVAAQSLAPREEGKWPFLGKTDEFSSEAALDLRSLNEKVAGESGFIRYDANGDFVRGDGKPIRFWAVNAVMEREKPFVARPRWPQVEPTAAGNARFLAKRGVNMVRLHAFLNPNLTKTPDAALTDVNMAECEWIWRSVAAYKQEGIYTMFSPYWAVNMKFSNAWGLPHGDKLNASGLLFFDETLQAAYKGWLKKLLTEPNPFTGVPLARDPALAIIQLQNEDSLLFWTVNNIPDPYKTDLGTRFYAWVVKKYGSYDAAREAWQNNRVAGDKPDEGVLLFHNLWEYTQPRTGGFSRRLADQLEFWVGTMRNFNSMMVAYLKDELGCGQLVNATNWKTGDPVRLEDAERYAYMTTDVMAVNRYTTGVHNGPNRTWAVVRGDEYTSPSILENPANFALNLRQPKGRPFLITEANWVPPMAYRSEGPLMVAAYSALNGIDGYFWFSMGSEQWAPPQSANGYLDSIGKWDFASPDVLGAFPGAALLYRGDYLKRGEPVLEEHRSLADLWMRRTPLVAEAASWDPNRDAGDVAPGSSVQTALPVQSFLAGPVHVVFDSDPARTKALPRESYMSADGAAVWSTTGEIGYNQAARLLVIDAPRAQGAAAFFATHPEGVETSALRIRSANDYGTILALSLDGGTLMESRKVFMQAVTRARPTGWSEETVDIKLSTGEVVKGQKITSHGKAPWQMWKNDFQIEFKNTRIARIVALDESHVPVDEVAFERTGEGIRFRFPEEALYILLTAE